MLRVKMFDIAAILLLPPLICQLSSCSASINGGFSGKAAVKKVIAMLRARSTRRHAAFPFFVQSFS